MSQTLLVLTVALLAFALSWFGCELMKQTGVVDAPDGGRKTQPVAVPRLGGIGVMGAIAIIYAAAGLAHTLMPGLIGRNWLPGQVPIVWIALAAAGLLALIGAIDDVFGLGAVTKLLLVLAICIAAPALGVAVPGLDTPFGTLTWPALALAGSVAWLLVFTNAANFMDGSNGLALGCLAIMFAGLGAAHSVVTHSGVSPGLVAVIAAIGAFLVHNLQGKLYAGDAGAFGLGSLFAALGLVSGLSVWTIATLALPFLIDVLMTLISRTRRGEPLFSAHLDHAYQGLIRSGWSHVEVAILWWGLSAACGVAAMLGASAGGALPFALFWGLTGAGAILWLKSPRQR